MIKTVNNTAHSSAYLFLKKKEKRKSQVDLTNLHRMITKDTYENG